MKTALAFLCALLLYVPVSAQDLPPDILADMYLLEATKALEDGDAQEAIRAFGKIEALDAEPPPEFAYFYGKLLVENSTTFSDVLKGQRLLKSYVIRIEKDSEHYTPTLELLSYVSRNLEKMEKKREAERRTEIERKRLEAKRQAEAKRRAEVERKKRETEHQAEAKRQADDAAFAKAMARGTVEAYSLYLEAHPVGRHLAEARRLRTWPRGKKFRDCAECPELIVVPAGSYMMGSPSSEGGRNDDEGPVHRVSIPKPFAVGVYEVTFDEWDACVKDGGCGGHRPYDEEQGRTPMAGVNWEHAQAYVKWLSRKTRKRYRLLSESEWEYVARAGTTGPFHFGLTISVSQANYHSQEASVFPRLMQVGSFPANEFGLHDVHGSVREWVEDCWHKNYRGAPSDGSAWTSDGNCGERVLRGGEFATTEPRYLRSAERFSYDYRETDIFGFRVARTLTP